VGVLTKFDLDDAGNAISALLGDVYPLRLGYTAVVCRTEGLHSFCCTFSFVEHLSSICVFPGIDFSSKSMYAGAKLPVKQE
jgi:hypothetical protein